MAELSESERKDLRAHHIHLGMYPQENMTTHKAMFGAEHSVMGNPTLNTFGTGEKVNLLALRNSNFHIGQDDNREFDTIVRGQYKWIQPKAEVGAQFEGKPAGKGI